MSTQHPTAENRKLWDQQGYFIVRSAISPRMAAECCGVIRNHVITPDVGEKRQDEIDPMDPMKADAPDARAARLRKLSRFCVTVPLIWHTIHCGEPVLRIARQFLGDDILCKFNSCFLKPAKTGSATPWHQDNGLWRDGETEPFNFWMALDPATKQNGCMQFIPGSHKTQIVEHVIYEDSIHGELPRDRVREMIDAHGVHHIELQPGDVVCWHSSLWHYSPPNTSDQSRIAVAGVYNSLQGASKSTRFVDYEWCMRDGEVRYAFPPQKYNNGLERAQPTAMKKAGENADAGAVGNAY